MNYKEEIQEYADDLASQKYGKDFYDLTEKQQEEIYAKAQEMYNDDFASQIDSMKEKRKFRGINHG